MAFAIEPMQTEDIPEVVEIEKICFTTPWPASAYKKELRNPKSTRYIVVRHYKTMPEPAAPVVAKRNTFIANLLGLLGKEEEPTPSVPNPNPVVGYAGLWMMMDEAHITTVGVDPNYRGKHLGELLLVGLIDVAMQLGASWLTLEVRVSNVVAQNLYKKYSFKEAGVRRKYYTDNNEDAYIMWSEEITKAAFRQKYFHLKADLLARLSQEEGILPGMEVTHPLIKAEISEEPLLPPPPMPNIPE